MRQIEHLSSYAHVVHATAKRVIPRRRKDESVCEMSKHKNYLWKKCYMKCGVWNQMKIWSLHLLDNLSNCLMNLKNSGDSTGFEPMTSATPEQCSNQLSYEVTQLEAGQFVGLMISRQRNVVWKKCFMKCGVWNQMKIRIPLSHLNFSGSWDNCLNCPASAKIISSFDKNYYCYLFK